MKKRKIPMESTLTPYLVDYNWNTQLLSNYDLLSVFTVRLEK